jgi:peptidoglycan lytic transglycosylase G
MSRYYGATSRRQRRIPHRVWGLLLGLLTLIVAGALFVRHIYYTDLSAVGNDQQTQIVTIQEGSSVKQIARQLQQLHLIRSAWAMELYIHSQELSDRLQAGTYAFSSSQSTPAIVSTMTKGNVTTKLVTILPGRRIDQVRADLINDGFQPSSVDAALQPSQYSNLPVLAYLPSGTATLEGLLWPDSFQKSADTDPSVIIRESLTEMGDHLTPALQASFAGHGLTVYQGLTLASIVEQEVNKPTDQAQVAQVFFSRLKAGMTLGSDVTAYYGSVAAGHPLSLTYNSPYNTLIHTGLPPTPISTVTANALNAVATPANTNWLYFVAGDDGTTYFSTTLQEHNAQTQQYCHKLCSE